jgi:rare lipoprotein A
MINATGAPVVEDPVSANPYPQQIDTAAPNAAKLGLRLAALGPTDIDLSTADHERPGNRLIPMPSERISLRSDNTIVGIASFYYDPQKTASGEQYDPDGYTAAAQLEIRHKFGGIKFGRLYRPAYAVGEHGGKKIIVRFNDVGPLRPGRKFDLSRATMAYFDPTLEKGLLPDFRMTPLPLGRTYPVGPVTDEQLAELGIGDGEFRIVPADATTPQEPSAETANTPAPAPAETEAAIVKPPVPDSEAVRPSTNEVELSFDVDEAYELRDWNRASKENATIGPV